MPLCPSVYLCLVVTCWERADRLALVCGVELLVCHFPIGILDQVWYLIVSIPDICCLTYFATDCAMGPVCKVAKDMILRANSKGIYMYIMISTCNEPIELFLGLHATVLETDPVAFLFKISKCLVYLKKGQQILKRNETAMIMVFFVAPSPF